MPSSHTYISHTRQLQYYYYQALLPRTSKKKKLVNRISNNYFINQMQMSNNKTLNYICQLICKQSIKLGTCNQELGMCIWIV